MTEKCHSLELNARSALSLTFYAKKEITLLVMVKCFVYSVHQLDNCSPDIRDSEFF